ncbi:MAG TPA: UDP-glucose/GDP-mannose dehydrogenase family protein [Granulicella sp.]|jgi:UDPglucose 6-dehydrogenase|nr:UDP-glucose/GDP-mannose dehydrogenase family protein [Granulicella sp.]
MNIAVIGAGYVGLVSAACFAELGHEVITVDMDKEKIARLRAGGVPIHEDLLPELLRRHHGKGLHFSTDIQAAFQFCDVAFICVGTPPSPNGDADLSFVEGVAQELALALDDHKIIVEKSTVPVGTCEAVSRTMVLHGARREDFSIASNPEFLREGTAVHDFLFPDRILLGVADEASRRALTAIYAPILDGSYYRRASSLAGPTNHVAKLIVTGVKSAELIKHASNAFLAMKISFINAVANVCEGVGADVREVVQGVGTDSRIGTQFLTPGIGYGGSCFPKDVLAFRSVAKSVGYDFALLTEVMKVNNEQKLRFVEKIRKALWTLRGKKLAVLGLAFKGGTDDVRESPALEIVQLLKAEGASIRAYDPAAMERARGALIDGTISFAADAYDACAGADAVLVLAEWEEFAALDLNRIRALLKLPILIDGKNVLQPSEVRKAGLHYYGVGSEAEAPLIDSGSRQRFAVGNSDLSHPATLVSASGD